MAHLWPSGVRETTSITGTGTYVLDGAVAGYFAFGDVMAENDTVDACIVQGAQREYGRYTMNGSGALVRTAVLRSTNADAAVSWTAGPKNIFAIHIGFSDLDATGLSNLALLVGTVGLSGSPATGQFPRFSGAAALEGLTATAFTEALSAKLAALSALAWSSGKILRLAGASTIEAITFDTDGTLGANSDDRLSTQKAVKTYVDGIVAAQDAMVFKGVIDCSANPNYPAGDRGHAYRVSVAGLIGGASGPNVEAGDLLLCLTDATASGNHATVGAQWSIVQANLDGAVIGPAGVTDGNPVLFDGASGRLVKQRTWAQFRGDADLEPGVDFAAIPTSSTLPVGWSGIMRYTSASSLADGATTAGANVQTLAFSGDFGSLGLNVQSGQVQTGMWRNINGRALQRISSNNDGEQIGLMERIS